MNTITELMMASSPSIRDVIDTEVRKALANAQYAIGIDTSDGFHTVTVFRMVPGQPSTLVASQRLPERGAA